MTPSAGKGGTSPSVTNLRNSILITMCKHSGRKILFFLQLQLILSAPPASVSGSQARPKEQREGGSEVAESPPHIDLLQTSTRKGAEKILHGFGAEIQDAKLLWSLWIPEKSLRCGVHALHRALKDSDMTSLSLKGCSPGFISQQNATASLQKETVCIQTKLTQIQNKALGNRIPDKSRDLCNSVIKLKEGKWLGGEESFHKKWRSRLHPISGFKTSPQQQNHWDCPHFGIPREGRKKEEKRRSSTHLLSWRKSWERWKSCPRICRSSWLRWWSCRALIARAAKFFWHF